MENDPFDGVTKTSFHVNLADLKASLFDELQKEDVSEAKPAHAAFEVEDMNTRQNFVFIKRENTVDLYDSSRGVGKSLLKSFEENPFCDFPFDMKSADEYYEHMYRKALRAATAAVLIYAAEKWKAKKRYEIWSKYWNGLTPEEKLNFPQEWSNATLEEIRRQEVSESVGGVESGN